MQHTIAELTEKLEELNSELNKKEQEKAAIQGALQSLKTVNTDNFQLHKSLEDMTLRELQTVEERLRRISYPGSESEMLAAFSDAHGGRGAPTLMSYTRDRFLGVVRSAISKLQGESSSASIKTLVEQASNEVEGIRANIQQIESDPRIQDAEAYERLVQQKREEQLQKLLTTTDYTEKLEELNSELNNKEQERSSVQGVSQRLETVSTGNFSVNKPLEDMTLGELTEIKNRLTSMDDLEKSTLLGPAHASYGAPVPTWPAYDKLLEAVNLGISKLQGESSSTSTKMLVEQVSKEVDGIRANIQQIEAAPRIQQEERIKILSFLNSGNNDGSTDSNENSDKNVLMQFLETIKNEYHKEEERVDSLQQYITSESNTATEEQEKFANEIADKLFGEFELTEEDKLAIKNLTGRERVGLAGLIYGGITGAMQLHTQATGQSHIKVSGLLSKWVKDPVSMLAMGNIIYKAVKDFEDGASTTEVFSFISQASVSIFSTANFINSFVEAKTESLTNGKSFLETLREKYTTSNMLDQKYSYSYNFDTDTHSLQSTRFVSKDVSDIVATDPMAGGTYKPLNPDGVVPPRVPDVPTSGINFGHGSVSDVVATSGIQGTYRPLGSGVGNVDPPKLPSQSLTPDVPSGGTGGKVVGGLAIAADLAWVGSAIANVADGEAKPSEIMDLIGSVIATAGDVVGLVGGPITQVVGMVISAFGGVVSAAGGLADLKSDSSPAEVGRAVGNFFLALNPLLPSVESVETAIEYQKLRDSADNEVDRIIYDALHKIASLDCTPLINLTHGAYNEAIREEAREELIDKFGSFDNMMKQYIVSDSEFQNNLNNAHTFLKENAHTIHTQFLTAYLTPAQINELFKDEEYHRSGYDVRSIQDNLQVKGEESNGAYKLKTAAGVSILPAGANLKNINGREVLDTVSLGYGTGKDAITDEDGNEVKNPRVIDTATQISYSNSQLQMFSTEFKHRHRERYISGYTGGGCIPGACGLGREPIYSYREDPKYARFKCWIDVVDDMSGLKTYSTRTVTDAHYGSMNPEIREVTEYNNLPDVNNRVISTISDIIFPKIETKAGDDDVILANVERVYNDGTGDSVVRAMADGGEGTDILDLSAIKENDDQTFDFKYSVKDNNLSYLRQNGDGKDYDLSFSNFEEIRLTKVNNKISMKDDSDIVLNEGEKPEEIRIIGAGAKENYIDFSAVEGTSLYFQGSLQTTNKISGTENNDVIGLSKIEDESTVGSLTAYGNGGNDMLLGGDFTGAGKNILHGGVGNDFIRANGVYSELYGGSDSDILQGADKGINKLNGGSGNDMIKAGKASAILNGDEGADFITGNIGQDVINGGIGDDYLSGGDGADSFVFSNDFGKDTIKDYESQDKLIFDSTSGVSSINDLVFMENEEQNYLALIHDYDVVKIQDFDDSKNLNITIGDKVVDSNAIESLIESSVGFNDYKDAIVSQISNPQERERVLNSISYSTQNQYSGAFSGSNTGQV
ncbi:hypothetical protein [Clostridium oceanicum]|uniref:Bifunctional hemolysin/adenylate cyclase n=1 Tax=Clostridium oceanicum TaxID=1543 RepID=A0ABN1JL53_9CLOT